MSFRKSWTRVPPTWKRAWVCAGHWPPWGLLRFQETQSISNLAQKLSKLDESAVWYRRLLGVDPWDRGANYSLGVIDWQEWHAARQEARSTTGMNPTDPGPLPVNAIRRELAGKYSGVIDGGIAQLQKAFEIDPQSSDAMAFLRLLIRADTAEWGTD